MMIETTNKECQRAMKEEALREIQEARPIYRDSGINAEELYEISRKMLEERAVQCHE